MNKAKNVVITKSIRGVPVKMQGDRMLITINEVLPQRGSPPRVGLSDALLARANVFNKTIYVHLKQMNKVFKTTYKEWMTSAKKEEQPSYYNKPWHIYTNIIPKDKLQNV